MNVMNTNTVEDSRPISDLDMFHTCDYFSKPPTPLSTSSGSKLGCLSVSGWIHHSWGREQRKDLELH